MVAPDSAPAWAGCPPSRDALRRVRRSVGRAESRPLHQNPSSDRRNSSHRPRNSSRILRQCSACGTFLEAPRKNTHSRLRAVSRDVKRRKARNWDPFPVPPTTLNAIVLTHAHLDHVGYLPRLVAQGYGGRVFCTDGTAELCRLVLPDSARIQQGGSCVRHRRSPAGTRCRDTPARAGLPIWPGRRRSVSSMRSCSRTTRA
jgi:hypothetical protein